jgi:hypothetical protein
VEEVQGFNRSQWKLPWGKYSKHIDPTATRVFNLDANLSCSMGNCCFQMPATKSYKMDPPLVFLLVNDNGWSHDWQMPVMQCCSENVVSQSWRHNFFGGSIVSGCFDLAITNKSNFYTYLHKSEIEPRKYLPWYLLYVHVFNKKKLFIAVACTPFLLISASYIIW